MVITKEKGCAAILDNGRTTLLMQGVYWHWRESDAGVLCS